MIFSKLFFIHLFPKTNIKIVFNLNFELHKRCIHGDIPVL